MIYYSYDITFQEVPGEISLTFLMSGCPLNCFDCHSKDAKDIKNGKILTKELFEALLNKYNGYITCVCFLGGEWFDDIDKYISILNDRNIKVCLYTGLNDANKILFKEKLTYLKVGHYNKELGDLLSRNTNQKFLNIKLGKDETHKFWERI